MFKQKGVLPKAIRYFLGDALISSLVGILAGVVTTTLPVLVSRSTDHWAYIIAAATGAVAATIGAKGRAHGTEEKVKS